MQGQGSSPVDKNSDLAHLLSPAAPGHLIDPHCNYCQFFETAIRNPISIVGNRPRSVARRAQASQRNSPLWLCESRGFSKPRA